MFKKEIKNIFVHSEQSKWEPYWPENFGFSLIKLVTEVQIYGMFKMLHPFAYGSSSYFPGL